MGTRLLREDPSRRKSPFHPKSFESRCTQYFQILLYKCPPEMLCGSNVTTFASWGPACSEKTLATKTTISSKFHLIQINAIFSNINIQMSPGMLCGSNDTIVVSRGPVCSEKTPPKLALAEVKAQPKFRPLSQDNSQCMLQGACIPQRFAIIQAPLGPVEMLRGCDRYLVYRGR